jgi:hypothetical protein
VCYYSFLEDTLIQIKENPAIVPAFLFVMNRFSRNEAYQIFVVERRKGVDIHA